MLLSHRRVRDGRMGLAVHGDRESLTFLGCGGGSKAAISVVIVKQHEGGGRIGQACELPPTSGIGMSARCSRGECSGLRLTRSNKPFPPAHKGRGEGAVVRVRTRC